MSINNYLRALDLDGTYCDSKNNHIYRDGSVYGRSRDFEYCLEKLERRHIDGSSQRTKEARSRYNTKHESSAAQGEGRVWRGWGCGLCIVVGICQRVFGGSMFFVLVMFLSEFRVDALTAPVVGVRLFKVDWRTHDDGDGGG